MPGLLRRCGRFRALPSCTCSRWRRLEGLLKILAVDDAVRRESGGWAGTGRPWYFDEQKWKALQGVRAAEAGLMRGYAHGDGCLMQFLQQVDDPDPQACGRRRGGSPKAFAAKENVIFLGPPASPCLMTMLQRRCVVSGHVNQPAYEERISAHSMAGAWSRGET